MVLRWGHFSFFFDLYGDKMVVGPGCFLKAKITNPTARIKKIIDGIIYLLCNKTWPATPRHTAARPNKKE
jgi:hypothetical protein